MQTRSVLFVCLGNICRSPMAEGAFRHRITQTQTSGGSNADRWTVDSAGLGSWHASDPPDPRAIRTARKNGFDISGQRARQVKPADFEDFDLILGMDRSNTEELVAFAGPNRAKIALFLDYALGRAADVPDPYYGGDDGFRHVLSLIEDASNALFEKLSA